MKEEILAYLNIQSRNKVVFHKTPIDGVHSHNVGVLLAEAIKGIKDDSRLSLKVSKLIDEIFNSCTESHPEFGEILALENVGILLEPDLKQDLGNLIDRYSKSKTLFIYWNGILENENLYFLSKEKGIRINLNELSHIIL